MPMFVWACGSVCVGVVVLVALLGTVLSIQAARHERYVTEKGQPVLGWIVQANAALYQPGESNRPAQVLITFDPAVGDPAAVLAGIAARVAALKGEAPRDPVEAEVARLVNDESYRPYERVLLPAAFTGGPEVYSAHVWVNRELLPAGVLDLPYVRCRAVKDDEQSRVVMVGYEPEDRRPARPF